jgi:hypothetical protein
MHDSGDVRSTISLMKVRVRALAMVAPAVLVISGCGPS